MGFALRHKYGWTFPPPPHAACPASASERTMEGDGGLMPKKQACIRFEPIVYVSVAHRFTIKLTRL